MQVTELLTLLRELALLDASRLQQVEADLSGTSAEPRSVLLGLARRGWISTFQANELILGRGRNLSLGPYLLLDLIGKGGMGEVYRAHHRRLDRIDAVKVIRPELLADPRSLARFDEEMRTTARLEHPNIVRIYNADRAGQVSYLAMQYLSGLSLDRILKHWGPLPLSRACDYVRQAAEGLQYAHERHIVHRDIKPHNLIAVSLGAGDLEAPTQTFPGQGASASPPDLPLVKIVDFGLARFAQPGQDAQASAIVGTPAFMAPEQLAGGKLDVRSDIYSLGCTFHFLLTGKPPFHDLPPQEQMAQRFVRLPSPVTQWRSEAPQMLADLLQRMLEPNPGDRFQTPGEVVKALAAFNWNDNGRPAEANAHSAAALAPHPVALPIDVPAPTLSRPASKRWRWYSVGAAATILAIVFVIIALSNGTDDDAKSNPDNPRTAGLEGLRQEDIPEAERFPELPDEAVAVLGERQGRHWGEVLSVAHSPDGKTIASGGKDNVIRLWEPVEGPGGRRTLRETAVLHGHARPVNVLAFDPQGKWLASADEGREVRVWDTASRRVVFTGIVGRFQSPKLLFQPHGKLFLAAGEDGLKLWETEKWTAQPSPPGGPREVSAAAFSRDGARLAAYGPPVDPKTPYLHAWTLSPLRAETVPDTFPGEINSLTFLPNDDLLLFGRGLYRWDRADGKIKTIRPREDGGSSASMVASPDGSVLAVSKSSERMTIQDAATGKEVGSHPLPGGGLRLTSFAPDGKRVVCCGGDSTVRIFDLNTDKPEPWNEFEGHTRASVTVAVSPDGRRIATGGTDRLIRLWDLSSGRPAVVAEIKDVAGPVARLEFLADNQTLIAWKRGGDGMLHIYDANTGRPREANPILKADGDTFAMTADGGVLLTVTRSHVHAWDLKTGQKQDVVKYANNDYTFALAVSPDGQRLAYFDSSGRICAWNRQSGQRLWQSPAATTIGVLAFTPDGARLAAGDSSGRILLFDPATGKETGTLGEMTGAITALHFSPDSKRLVSASSEGGLQVRNLTADAGPRVGPWKLPGTVHDVRFSADGRHLITANANGTAYVLRLPSEAP